MYLDDIAVISITCPDGEYVKYKLICRQARLQMTYADERTMQTEIAFSYDFTGNRQWQIGIDNLNLVLLRFSRLLTKLFPGQEIKAGLLQGQLQMQGQATNPTSLNLQGQLTDFSLEGTSVFEKVDAVIELDVQRQREKWSFNSAIRMEQGAMYLVPGISVLGDQPGFFIEAGVASPDVFIKGIWAAEQDLLDIEQFTYRHQGMVTIEGGGLFHPASEIAITDFTLKAVVSDLTMAYPIYFQPMFLQTDFSDISVHGSVELDVSYRDGYLKRLNVMLDDATVEDEGFGIRGLNGNLALGDTAEPIQSAITWSGMNFHRLEFGDGHVVFESSGSKVRVLEWKDVGLLDGVMHIDSFEMAAIGGADFTLIMDARLSDVSMAAFTQAMDWQLMSGSLSGAFSGLKYFRNSLEMNGDINVQVFDGDIRLQNLLITDLFSQYASLSADVAITGLDLEKLTGTFTFGKIEGRLNGAIDDLILEDWKPASFKAWLESDEDDDKPHRISQRALNNLNELGGGLGGTMSKGYLRLFPSYSYGKLGVRCHLNNNICELGGLEENDQGFHLLTRGGLLPPWVEVKAVGRSIRWDELIDGMKQILEGEVKIE